jgi:hypothetical protein
MVSVPHRPRSVAAAIQILEFLPLLKCIHTCPESLVGKGKKLALCNQSARALPLVPRLLYVLEDLAPEHKKATVDPRTGLRYLLDALHNAFSVDLNHVRACSRLHTYLRKQSGLPMSPCGVVVASEIQAVGIG